MQKNYTLARSSSKLFKNNFNDFILTHKHNEILAVHYT